jgi:hypothetical protein
MSNTKSVLRIAASLLLVASLPARAHVEPADHFYNAMKLSIEHFNADHSKDLRSWGPEHRFMFDLLNTVAREIPAVAAVTEIDRSSDNELDPFASLSFTSEFETSSADPAILQELKELQRTIALITQGCAYDQVVTTESSHSRRGVHSTTTTEITYRVNALGASPECANPALAQKLNDLGIGSIQTRERPTYFGQTEYSFVTRPLTNIWRDMDYVRNKLLADPETAFLGATLKAYDFSQPRIGSDRSSIRLIGSSGKASPQDSVSLEYVVGWGDCPSGCIYRHEWVIEVQPTVAGDGSVSYAVRLLSESGDPIPAGGVPSF